MPAPKIIRRAGWVTDRNSPATAERVGLEHAVSYCTHSAAINMELGDRVMDAIRAESIASRRLSAPSLFAGGERTKITPSQRVRSFVKLVVYRTHRTISYGGGFRGDWANPEVELMTGVRTFNWEQVKPEQQTRVNVALGREVAA